MIPSMKNQRGYGLVVAIMIILALAVSAPVVMVTSAFLADQEKVKSTQEKMRRLAFAVSSTNIKSAVGGMRSYEQDVGALPSALSSLETKPAPVSACSFNTTDQDVQGWCGPYWAVTFTGESSFTDEWGRTITYDSANRRIYSWGPDGADDTGGDDDLVQTF